MSNSKDNVIQRMVQESFDTLHVPQGLNMRTYAALEQLREAQEASFSLPLDHSSKSLDGSPIEQETHLEAYNQLSEYASPGSNSDVARIIEIKPNNSKHRRRFQKLFYAIAACLILTTIGVFGGWLYFTPTAFVAIDVNPSIELSVNRFDYVISEHGINDDGISLLNEISMVGKPYSSAIENLVTSQAFSPYTTEESYVEVNISCDDQNQTQKLVAASTASLDTLPGEAVCYIADDEEWDAAHLDGIGLGRYRIIQELLSLDPSLSLEDCSKMSMGEIRSLIASITSEANATENTESNNEDSGSTSGNDVTQHHQEETEHSAGSSSSYNSPNYDSGSYGQSSGQHHYESHEYDNSEHSNSGSSYGSGNGYGYSNGNNQHHSESQYSSGTQHHNEDHGHS